MRSARSWRRGDEPGHLGRGPRTSGWSGTTREGGGEASEAGPSSSLDVTPSFDGLADELERSGKQRRSAHLRWRAATQRLSVAHGRLAGAERSYVRWRSATLGPPHAEEEAMNLRRDRGRSRHSESPAPTPHVPAPSQYTPGGGYGDEGPGTLDRDSRIVRPNDPYAPKPRSAPAVPIMPTPASVTPVHDPAPVAEGPGAVYGVPDNTAAQPRPGSTAPPGFA